MKQLHPGVKWSFRLGSYFAFGFLGIFFGTFLLPVFAFILILLKMSFVTSGILFLLVLIGYFIFIIIGSEIFTNLSYKNWSYEFTKDQLRLERGIIWKIYSNIPYERIQNVDIQRGILARMLGYSSVMIQTAGYSGMAMSEGYIPAVDMNEAEEIREFVIKKLKKGGSKEKGM
jgi:membrane protein YdbS with pleckstrin-like domain